MTCNVLSGTLNTNQPTETTVVYFVRRTFRNYDFTLESTRGVINNQYVIPRQTSILDLGGTSAKVEYKIHNSNCEMCLTDVRRFNDAGV